MTKVVFSLIYFLLSLSLLAQEQYIFKNDTLTLKTEVEGDLDFLTYKAKDHHRFFVKDKDGSIYELLNTRQDNNVYAWEYKDVLDQLTAGSRMSTDMVGFGHYSLKQFIRAYNSHGTRRYTYTGEKVNIQSRMGFWGGITNYSFIENKNNAISPSMAMEFEVFAKVPKPKQTGYFSIGHVFESSKFKYSSTQLALGYRYRAINTPTFNLYADLKFATYTFSKQTFELPDDTNDVVKETIFHIPMAFGLGSDIRVTNTSFISLAYNNLVAFFDKNGNNFPIDLSVGYKVNL